MEEWQKRQLDRWHRTGYLPRLFDLAKSYSAPFWWYDPDASVGSAIKHNGTIVFVDTGARLLGVTAQHVHAQYQRDIAEKPSLACQAGGITFEPRPLASSERLDLATFELSEVFVNGARANIYSAMEWPPPPLQPGELALLGGSLGNLRNERLGEADFYFASFITRADTSSAANAGILLNLRESHSSTDFKLQPGADLGGASGGPVFRVHDGAPRPLELVGFIYEYSESLELVYARHAASLNATGSYAAIRISSQTLAGSE